MSTISNEVTWANFERYNQGKDIKAVFERLCYDFFMTTNKTNEIVIIEPNNPGIETHPILGGTIGFQAKHVKSISAFDAGIKESFMLNKIKPYKNLKKIFVFSNINFKQSKKSILTIKKRFRGKIDFDRFDGETFINELKKFDHYELHNEYFGIRNLTGFFEHQKIKTDYNKARFQANMIRLVNEKKEKTTLTTLNKIITKADNKIISILGKPGAGKSYLLTHLHYTLAKQYLSKKNIFPITIALGKRDGRNLVDYIASILQRYTVEKINSYKHIVLFLDGINEIPTISVQNLKDNIEEIKGCHKNIKKIIITSRFGSLKNTVIRSCIDQEFTIENLSPNSTIDHHVNLVKNASNSLPLLYHKYDSVTETLGILATENDWYDEKNYIEIKELQNLLSTKLGLKSNEEINQVFDFLIDNNILQIIESDRVNFADQKLQEYYFSKHISKNFSAKLKDLRKYNFFSNTDLMNSLTKVLNIDFAQKPIHKIIIKNLFLSSYKYQSGIDTGRGFNPDSILFLKALTKLENFSIYLNESSSVGAMFENYIMNRQNIYLLKLWGFNDLSNNYYHRLLVETEKKRDEWNNFYEKTKKRKQDKEGIERDLEDKYRELNMSGFYSHKAYKLLLDLDSDSHRLPYDILSKKDLPPSYEYEIAHFLVLLLKKGQTSDFTKYFQASSNDRIIKKFICKITEIDNLPYLLNISEDNLKKMGIPSLNSIIKSLGAIKYFSNDSDLTLSYLLIRLTKGTNISGKDKTSLLKVIHSDVCFREVGKFSTEKKQSIDYKILTIYSQLAGERRSILPLSTEYKNYLSVHYVFVGIIDWYLKFLKGENNIDSFCDFYVQQNIIYQELRKTHQSLHFLHTYIIGRIISYLANENLLPESFYDILLHHESSFTNIKGIIEQLINHTDFHNTNGTMINTLIQSIKKEEIEFGFNDLYEIKLILSYLNSCIYDYTKAGTYFKSALNDSYLRYGRRKDYFFDIILEVIEKGYNANFIGGSDLYNFLCDIYINYSSIVEFADGKGIRQVPTLIYELIGKYIPKEHENFQKKFKIDKYNKGYYFLLGDINIIYFKIVHYSDIDDIVESIKALDDYASGYNNNSKEMIFGQFILTLILLSIPFYKNLIKNDATYTDILNEFINNGKDDYDSYSKIKTGIDHIRRSVITEELVCKHLQNVDATILANISGDINDITKKEFDPIIDSINKEKKNPLNVDYSIPQNYKKFLERDGDLDYSSLTKDNITNILSTNRHNDKELMQMILKSDLFLSSSSGYYMSYYGKDFGMKLGMGVYEINKNKFRETINNPLYDKYYTSYMTNFVLISNILISEGRRDEYKDLVSDLVNFCYLLCSGSSEL